MEPGIYTRPDDLDSPIETIVIEEDGEVGLVALDADHPDMLGALLSLLG